MKKLLNTFAASLLVSIAVIAQAQTNPVPATPAAGAPSALNRMAAESPEAKARRMEWWREAKFGMFIHWGVYSVPAGIYHGRAVTNAGEWIMYRAKIPMAEYQSFAKDFNPVKFDAEAWVKIAKDAGMKYIIITAKHHDGFAMFPSKVSKWNITDATPWHRDPLQELAEACRRQGIKLGFYYSQAQDWNNGGSTGNRNWDQAQEHDMDDYIDTIAVPQVKELLSRYGEFPAVLWWDTPKNMTTNRAERLYSAVHALKPDIIMNNRLGGGLRCDTETPEQYIPAQGYPGRDWETCMTMNGTWGYKRDDQDWKSPEMLIRNLCDIASKGGNYLLNVGPTSEGLIPSPSSGALAEIGAWMKVNGDAIYGTGPTPFSDVHGKFSETEKDWRGNFKFISTWDWRCTSKAGKLYLFIFDWPKNGKFQLLPMQDKVQKVWILSNKTKVNYAQTDAGVILDLPAIPPDKIASVLCIEFAKTSKKVAFDPAADAERKAAMSPGELEWEKVLEENLGDFYLPYYKNDKRAGKVTAWDYVKDDPALPRVLLIGDSISRGYTLDVRRDLAGRANVHRAPANCGATTLGLRKMDAWLGGGHWDVIHFNFGIHDRNLPAATYATNLEQIVIRLEKTGAKLIWARTTPPASAGNAEKFSPEQCAEVNRIADGIMRQHGIPIDDLCSPIQPRLAEFQNPNNVHFNDAGYKFLAEKVAGAIMAQLSEPLK